ncbi:MAG: hypothetical protein PHW13_12080 [Methylococcales bacterium]|nr:hypothetical protein [Methylococcales bacterium]
MNIKNLMLITILAMSAATSVASPTTIRSAQKNSSGLPATPLQLQILATRPEKISEFARFEAVPVSDTKTFTYQGRSISPNQLEVLGKKMK